MNGISATTLLFEAPDAAVARCRIGFRTIADGDWLEAARQFKAAANENAGPKDAGPKDADWAAKACLFARELANIALVQAGKH